MEEELLGSGFNQSIYECVNFLNNNNKLRKQTGRPVKQNWRLETERKKKRVEDGSKAKFSVDPKVKRLLRKRRGGEEGNTPGIRTKGHGLLFQAEFKEPWLAFDGYTGLVLGGFLYVCLCLQTLINSQFRSGT